MAKPKKRDLMAERMDADRKRRDATVNNKRTNPDPVKGFMDDLEKGLNSALKDSGLRTHRDNDKEITVEKIKPKKKKGKK